MPVFYNPATDSTLKLWMDASDPSTLKDTSGAAITDGATIGTWTSKDSAARAFTQWGSNGRPVWRNSPIKGQCGAEFTAASKQVLVTSNVTSFTGISGLTVMVAFKNKSGNGSVFAMDITDKNTGFRDINLLLLSVSGFAGWRVNTDTFTFVTGDSVPANTITTVTAGINYTTALADLMQGGVEKVLKRSYGTAGSTSASEPAHITVGGQSQQSGFGINVPFDGFLGEVLAWPQYFTPDQLVPPHTYMRLKWGPGIL